MIVTLCGSNRFEPFFHVWMEALSLSGHAVFGLSAYASYKEGTCPDPTKWYTKDEKELLDQVHKCKIDASHAIVVLNLFGYIGESTMAEVIYAKERRKDMYFLESWGAGLGFKKHTHLPEIMKAKAAFNIDEDYVSPIDTWHTETGSRRDPYDLLTPTHPLRTNIVERIADVEAKYKFGR